MSHAWLFGAIQLRLFLKHLLDIIARTFQTFLKREFLLFYPYPPPAKIKALPLKVKTARKYRIDVFILVSFLLHILFAMLSGLIPVIKPLPRKMDPVKVTFLEEKKPDPKPEEKSSIVDTPKPRKIEKPRSRRVLSRYNSRMHSNQGKKAKVYKDHKTAIPMSKPKPAVAPPPSAKKAPGQKKKTGVETATKKKLERIPKAKRRYKRLAKLEKDEKKTSAFSESVMRKKYDEGKEKNKTSMESEQSVPKSMLMKTPLLDGADLEKYARLDTGAAKKEAPTSDSDTISLDTKEFKYVSYFAQIKRKIELVWSYPAEAGRQGLFGKLLLKFTIQKDGTLSNLTLINSTGHKILDDEAIRAVRMAAPYPPFPKRIDKKRLNIIATFSYYPSFSLVD